jgi:hypothetical protein
VGVVVVVGSIGANATSGDVEVVVAGRAPRGRVVLVVVVGDGALVVVVVGATVVVVVDGVVVTVVVGATVVVVVAGAVVTVVVGSVDVVVVEALVTVGVVSAVVVVVSSSQKIGNMSQRRSSSSADWAGTANRSCIANTSNKTLAAPAARR